MDSHMDSHTGSHLRTHIDSEEFTHTGSQIPTRAEHYFIKYPILMFIIAALVSMLLLLLVVVVVETIVNMDWTQYGHYLLYEADIM